MKIISIGPKCKAFADVIDGKRLDLARYKNKGLPENSGETETETQIDEFQEDDLLWPRNYRIKKTYSVLGKKMKIWERRLMKDFQVAGPVNPADVDLQEEITLQQPKDENNIERWKRIARLAVLTSAEHRWSQVVKNAVKSSQIGKSCSRTSLQNQQSLKRAMEEAKRLTQKSPLPLNVPVELPETTASTILHVLHDIVEDDSNVKASKFKREKTPEPRNGIGFQPIESILQAKSTSSVDFIDEKTTKATAPLLPLRSSPPRVIKRKAPTQLGQLSTSAQSTTTQLSTTTNATSIVPVVSITTATATTSSGTAPMVAVTTATTIAPVTMKIATMSTKPITTTTATTTTIITAITTAAKPVITSTTAKATATAIVSVATRTSNSQIESQSKSTIASINAPSISIKDGSSSIRARPKASHSPKLSIIPSLTVTSSSDGSKDREKLVGITSRSRPLRGGWL